MTMDLDSEVGDFGLRNAHGIYSYHLANVVDDMHLGITHVVRGADLAPFTAAHLHLQRTLGGDEVHYHHLPLALDDRGRKLSKQTHAPAVDDLSVSEALNAVFGHSIPNLCVDRWGNGIRIFPQTLMLPYYYMIIDSDFEFNEPYENITEVCHMLRTVHFTKFGKPFSFQSWKSKINTERNSHAVDRCLDDIGAQWNSVKMHVC